MSIKVISPGEGEESGGGPIRARIIEDGSNTGHRLGIIEGTIPPGPAQPPPPVLYDPWGRGPPPPPDRQYVGPGSTVSPPMPRPEPVAPLSPRVGN